MSANNSQNYENVPPRVAFEIISAGDCRIFDVRTPPEYASHHISGAHLLPIQELNERHLEIPRDSDQKILIICEHGVRSVHACRALSQAGWRNIVNVSGGMAEWVECRLPYEGTLARQEAK